VLQASEGGSFSVGNRKFKVRQSVTPRPELTPPSSDSLERVPDMLPTNLRPNRMSPVARLRRLSPLRLTTLATLSPATDKMVVSKSALVGFCLTAFAGGVALTLTVDRLHARAAEPAREAEPVVLKTTPLETAPAAAAPGTPAPAIPAAPALAAPIASPPAAAEAVVVQLPPPAESQANKPNKETPKAAPAPAPAEPAVHSARKVAVATPVPAPAPHKLAAATPVAEPAPPPARKVAAAAPAHAVAPRKQAKAVESSPTEAAPEEDPVLPTATKKKWSDPFDP
jgi:hypothetical protein